MSMRAIGLAELLMSIDLSTKSRWIVLKLLLVNSIIEIGLQPEKQLPLKTEVAFLI